MPKSYTSSERGLGAPSDSLRLCHERILGPDADGWVGLTGNLLTVFMHLTLILGIRLGVGPLSKFCTSSGQRTHPQRASKISSLIKMRKEICRSWTTDTSF